ncbi:DNA topoisomerase [Marinomonas sp. 2405UD68-3]|uniref:DNA topoisomerase n=1 Tax=Marinomonas sp. 2405UD68-3 TaxID=3391835 RepID=UPI0039C9142D
MFSNTLLKNSAATKSGYTGMLNEQTCFVTYTNGHLYSFKMPDENDPKYKIWSLDTLPIECPSEFKVIEGKEELAKTINEAINHCKLLVLASDPDPQGVYLADLVRKMSGYKGPLKRSGIKTHDPKRLAEQFSSFENLDEYRQYLPIAASEACRSMLDYKFGINLTRLFTVLAKKNNVNMRSPAVVGRIQSSILSIVCQRHYQIVNFKPTPFYNIFYDAYRNVDNTKIRFKVDLERITDIEEKDRVLSELSQEPVKNVDVKEKEVFESPAEPHKQSTLQVALGKRFNYSPSQVLEAASANYDDGYQSYPRTDDNKIEFSEWARAEQTLQGLLEDIGIGKEFINYSKRTSFVIRAGEQNDSAHTAILPTGKSWDKEKSGIRWEVFQEITRRFAMQFMDDFEYEHTKISARVGSYSLNATGNTIKSFGWKQFEPSDDMEEKEKALPIVNPGDEFTGTPKASRSSTKPPKRFQQHEIIEALENIHKYIPESHQELAMYFTQAEVCGLGSPATRAGTLQKTINYKLLEISIEKKKSYILPTKMGLSLYDALPYEITNLSLICEMERDLTFVMNKRKKMSEVKNTYDEYVNKTVNHYINNPDDFDFQSPIQVTGYECGVCGSQLIQLESKNSTYWRCQSCGAATSDFNNKPVQNANGHGTACQKQHLDKDCTGILKTFVGKKRDTNEKFVTLKCSVCRQFSYPKRDK